MIETVIPAALQEQFGATVERMRDGITDGVEEFRAMLQLAPNCLDFLGNLAFVVAHRGDYEESVELYRRYLELCPQAVEPRWRLGDRLINLGRLADAVEAYESVLHLAPNCEDARMGLRYVRYLRQREEGEQSSVSGPKDKSDSQRSNGALNQEEFRRGRSRLRSLPPAMYLESTLKCNQHCQTCPKGYAPYYAEDLQESVLDVVQREVMPTNVRISITGFGEPTMASHFDRILRMSLDNGSFVHFVTNASLLNFARLEALARHPVDIGISMDGATRETFESIRAGSNFERVCEKLTMIRKLRDIHLSRVFATFTFLVVGLRKNMHELPDIVRLAVHYGIGRVHVADYHFNSNEFDMQSMRFEPEKANRCLEETKAVATELGIEIHVPPPYSEEPPLPLTASLWQRIRTTRRIFPARNRFPQRCHSPWSEPYIHTDGTVTPCCASMQYLGDLKKSSFGEVWNGWRYRLLRQTIHSVLPPPQCRECNVAWGINGGNTGNAKAKEGLVVKALYYLERRLLRIWERVRGKLTNRVPQPGPAPNFYRGRPWKGESSSADANK